MTAKTPKPKLPHSDGLTDPDGEGEDGLADPTLRRCIVTREVADRAQLIRFVVGPDGEVTPDLQQKLPGRGLWVRAERSILERATAKGLFQRAAKQPVRVPPDLVDRVTGLTVRRCLDLISLARRAGEAVAGFEKTAARLASGHAAVLLTASDAGLDGRRKAGKLAAMIPAGSQPPHPVTVLAAEELGQCFGRPFAVHGAVDHGGLAARLVVEAGRLMGLRNSESRPQTIATVDGTGG